MSEHLVPLQTIIKSSIRTDFKYTRLGKKVVFGAPNIDTIRHTALSDEAKFPDLVEEAKVSMKNVDAGKIIFIPPALLYITETSGYEGKVGGESESKEETARVLRAEYPDLTFQT